VHWRRPEEFLDATFDLNRIAARTGAGQIMKMSQAQAQNTAQRFQTLQTAGIQHDENQIHVFYDSIEPNDVKESCLNNLLNVDYFLSAVSILAQRPPLIERLFITKDWNPEGIYRIKLCKGGEWVEVTVDDLFPCEPLGGPLFTGCVNNEIWVMILEKAFAKVHGSYYLLKGGFVNEALIDLTGCPTQCYNLKDDYVQHFIQNGNQFWELIKYFHNEGYLLSFSTPGEERWSKQNQKEVDAKDGDVYMHGTRNEQTGENRLPIGQAFAVQQIRDLSQGHVKLVELRAPLQKYEWTGDWSKIPNTRGASKWTADVLEQMRHQDQVFNDELGVQSPDFVRGDENDSDGRQKQQAKQTRGLAIPSADPSDENNFWMSFENIIQRFTCLNVCKAVNMDEVRIRGKFLRVQDVEVPSIEIVASKWYYSVEVEQDTRVFLGVHQEDERKMGVSGRRPYLDIGIAVLRRTGEGLKLIDLRDFQ